ETGNALTYARDIAVKQWARSCDILVHETPNGGVVRVLKSRDAGDDGGKTDPTRGGGPLKAAE
ncbi:MAG: hypothetical protein AAFZ04_16285, partial [Pseudomonadota bacterium]